MRPVRKYFPTGVPGCRLVTLTLAGTLRYLATLTTSIVRPKVRYFAEGPIASLGTYTKASRFFAKAQLPACALSCAEAFHSCISFRSANMYSKDSLYVSSDKKVPTYVVTYIIIR